MNLYFVTSGLLLIAIALVHSLLGEKFLIQPLQQMKLDNLKIGPKFAKRTLRFAWHLTTIAWWGIGALLIYWASVESTHALSVSVGILVAAFLVSSVISLVVSRGKHWISWVGFAVIAMFAVIGVL
jgi:hypothetical protein